jgi:dTDP-4-amino-4,6-dideoxygalactose transaminase
MYYVLLSPGIARQAVLDDLNNDGINAVFHYVPLHSSLAGQKYGRQSGDLSITDSISERLIRLPLWIGLTLDQQDYVVQSLSSALCKK